MLLKRGKAVSLRAVSAAAALLCASGVALLSGSALAESDVVAAVQAQSSDPFSALVGKRRPRQAERASRGEVERYVLAGDDRAFLFEDRTSEARVKFLCTQEDPRIACLIDSDGPAPEIYVLTPTRGPRGDVIYKNRSGDSLLRIASYGGATVFWPGENIGLAASKSFGDDSSLTLPYAEFETATRRAQGATAILSALTGAPIVFDIGPAPDTEGQRSSVLADSVIVTAKAVKNVADDSTGARIIASRINKVAFIQAAAPSVLLNETVLEIRYTPELDLRGRPSSTLKLRDFWRRAFNSRENCTQLEN